MLCALNPEVKEGRISWRILDKTAPHRTIVFADNHQGRADLILWIASLLILFLKSWRWETLSVQLESWRSLIPLLKSLVYSWMKWTSISQCFRSGTGRNNFQRARLALCESTDTVRMTVHLWCTPISVLCSYPCKGRNHRGSVRRNQHFDLTEPTDGTTVVPSKPDFGSVLKKKLKFSKKKSKKNILSNHLKID